MHGLFGTKHIILILISFAAIALCAWYFKRQRLEKVYKLVLYTGIVSEFIKVFYYIIQNEDTHHGVLPKSDLPFHLCSIQIILIAVVVYSKSESLKRLILSFMMPSCLVGGIAAILIATESSRNGMYILSLQYFGYHAVISAFAIALLTSKELSLSFKDYLNCLKLLIPLTFFSIYINSIIYDGTEKINFMYVVSPPQEGLPYLNEDHGWLVYIIHYAFLIVFAITLCYIKQIITAIKERRKSK